jgi:hypothetical protein
MNCFDYLLISKIYLLVFVDFDAAHKYHDAAICVARHENDPSFSLSLDIVKAELLNFFEFKMQPQCSVPDKAKAIYTAHFPASS